MKHQIARWGAKPASIAVLGISSILLPEVGRADDAITNAPPKWESSAAAGLTLTRGNSRTTLATANIQTQRKTKLDEILLGADVTYGDESGTKNAESLHGFGQYNRLATDRWYYGIRLDGMHDAIADINYRFTLAPLGGYYFVKEKNTTLAGEAGPALVYEDVGHVTHGYATLRAAERFEHKFSATARMWQSFEILPQVDKFDNYVINFEIGAEAALTKHVSLRSYIQDTYRNIPALGHQKNDVKLVAAIAYKF